MRLIKEKGFYILSMTGIILISALFAFYYYCIHLGFTPNGEELTMVIKTALGGKTENALIWDAIYKIAYTYFGISYTTLRVAHSMLYFLLVSATFVLALKDKYSKSINWYIAPLFAFLMAILHTGGSLYYGQLDESFHQYPFDNHTLPTIFALWVILCLQHFFNLSTKRRYWWLCAALLLSVFGIIKTDLLFCIILVAPVIIFALVELLKRMKAEVSTKISIVVYTLFAVLAVICVLRIIYFTTPFLGDLFNVRSINGYGNSRFYGDADFVEINKIGTSILWYINGVLGLFNVNISNLPIIHIFSIIYLFRLILIGLTIYFIIRYLSQWWKNDKTAKTDYIDIILSLGIVILSFVVLITQWGEEVVSVRYMVGILPFASILLCRNFKVVNQWLKFDNNKFMVGTFIFFIMCCFIYAKPIGELEKNPDFWDDEYSDILALIEEENLGTGVGSIWIGHVLTCLSEGEHFVYGVDTNRGTENIRFYLKEAEEAGPECNYIIQGPEDWKYTLLEEEKMEKYFGEPVKIYHTRRFTIYKYDYNIAEKFRKIDG